MADDRAKKMAEEALNRLTSELEAGKSEALQNYLATMGRFHRYSWNNVLMISSQRPTATRVAGYHTWKDLERQVKSGEKGIMILAPIKVKQREQDRNHPSPGETVTKKDDIFRVAGFRAAFVFDVSQTEGKELPQFSKTTGDPKEYAEKLKALVVKQGIDLEYDDSIAPAQGVSHGGKIRLMPGMQPAEEFSVLAHELAHEMLHHDKVQERAPKVIVETQAEAVAYVVCRGIGLETNSAAADYISLYNGDKKTLAESLSIIQVASSRILDELLPEQRPTQSHEKQPDKTFSDKPAESQEKPGRTSSDKPVQSHDEQDRPNSMPPPTATQTQDQSESISFDR
jgi:hypothetical protein